MIEVINTIKKKYKYSPMEKPIKVFPLAYFIPKPGADDTKTPLWCGSLRVLSS